MTGAERLRKRLAEIPRVRLVRAPTPLDHAPRLTAALGGPRILVKREDLAGIGTGGSKYRILEFTLGAALEAGADVLVAGGLVQSNHPQQVAAAGARLGLPVVAVLADRPEPSEWQGNLLLGHLAGAEIRLLPGGDLDGVRRAQETVAGELRSQGRRPAIVARRLLGPRAAYGEAGAPASWSWPGRSPIWWPWAVCFKHTLSICAPSVSQHAALAALTGPQDCIEEAQTVYRERRQAFVQRLRELKLPFFPPAGTFYVFADISGSGVGSDAFCEDLLRKAGVFVYPGRRFGEYGEGFVRISLLAPIPRLLEGLNRMAAHLGLRPTA